MKDGIKLIGTVLIETRNRQSGKVIEREELKNLIVNTGKERVAKLLCGVSADYFEAIAIGTSSTSPATSQTALLAEVKRASAVLAYEASYKATFEHTFTFGTAESYTITEAGVFDSAVVSGSVMLDRFTFTGKLVDIDTDLYIKVTVTVA